MRIEGEWSPKRCAWCGGELAHHAGFSERWQYHDDCYREWLEWQKDAADNLLVDKALDRTSEGP